MTQSNLKINGFKLLLIQGCKPIENLVNPYTFNITLNK